MSMRISGADRIWLAAQLAREGVPGLGLALLAGGRVAATAVCGTADTATEAPLTEQTLFEAASLTKPLFAQAVLRLVAEGTLDLDRPLLDYLPASEKQGRRWLVRPGRPSLYDYVAADRALHEVTVRRVLSHSGGFSNWSGAGSALRLHFPPGLRFSYAGDGFQFLQDVLAVHLGEDPAALVRRLVLAPLGMAGSALQDSELAGRPVAQPHDKAGAREEKMAFPLFYSAAGLHTTAGDYGRFMAAALTPGPAAGHLDPALQATMLTPQVAVNDDPPWRDGWPRARPRPFPGVWWGLGWGLQEAEGERAFWHWGDNGGYKAFAIGYPERGAGLVMLSNGRNGGRLWRPLLDRTFPGRPQPALDWLESISAG